MYLRLELSSEDKQCCLPVIVWNHEFMHYSKLTCYVLTYRTKKFLSVMPKKKNIGITITLIRAIVNERKNEQPTKYVKAKPGV